RDTAGRLPTSHQRAVGVRLLPGEYIQIVRRQPLGPLEKRGHLAVLAGPRLIVVAVEIQYEAAREGLPEYPVHQTIVNGVDELARPTREILSSEGARPDRQVADTDVPLGLADHRCPLVL